MDIPGFSHNTDQVYTVNFSSPDARPAQHQHDTRVSCLTHRVFYPVLSTLFCGPLFNKCEPKRVKFVWKTPFHLLCRAASYRPLVAALELYSFKRVTDNIVSRLNILLLQLSSSLTFLVFPIQKRWSVLRHPKTLLHWKHT